MKKKKDRKKNQRGNEKTIADLKKDIQHQRDALQKIIKEYTKKKE